MGLIERIAADILPAAERRVAALGEIDVMGVRFGARATARAFGPDGEFRFELGRPTRVGFETFKAPVFFPLPPERLVFEYPKQLQTPWHNLNAHYTPVTRRRDLREVWDYFSSVRLREADVRKLALGALADEIARRFPGGRIAVSSRFVRYTEQYVVVTRVEARDLAAAGAAEAKAVASLI